MTGRIRFWWRWWTGHGGVGPYRRDAIVWWLTGGPWLDRRATAKAAEERRIARGRDQWM